MTGLSSNSRTSSGEFTKISAVLIASYLTYKVIEQETGIKALTLSKKKGTVLEEKGDGSI
jgi:uncharacterized protein YerC